jgi:hypothetical protein
MENLEWFIGRVATQFESMPDKRRGQNIQYSMVDIGMGAFSVFYMQSKSWLEHQKLLNLNNKISNFNTLFHAENIPTDNHVRNMLDGIDPEFFRPVFDDILIYLENSGVLDKFKVLDDRMLISIDGTEFFNSKNIHCNNCNSKYHKKSDEKEYYHTMVGFSICSPNTTSVIPFMPLFPTNCDLEVKNCDNKELVKQDNEYKVFKRCLENRYIDFDKYKPIYLGDALYGTLPIIKLIKETNNSNFIITCKPGSQKNIFNFVNACDLNIITKIIKIDSNKSEKHTYEYLNNIPLVDSNDDIRVNYISITIEKVLTNKQIERLEKKAKTNSKNKNWIDLIKIQKFTFITDIEVNEENIEYLIKCGRTRWRLENGFNSLKNRGYNFDHNFGHGKLTLSNFLATLMILAFLIHTATELTEPIYQNVRDKYSSAHSMINTISVLSSFLIFPSFNYLFLFIASGRKIDIRSP